MQWLFFEQYSHEPNIVTSRFWLKTKILEETPFNQWVPHDKALNSQATPVGTP